METTIDGRHDTPEWRDHPGPYALCIVRIPAAPLQPELDALRRDLHTLPNIRLHPDRFLHITLQELGFVVESPQQSDELTYDRLEEFAQAASIALSNVSPVSIGVGGANSFQDAVFLDILHGAPLQMIHERLFDLASISRIPEFPYLPHCTIGHYLGGTPPRDLVSAIAPWRDTVCGELEIGEIEIVTLDPRETYPELASYVAIPLGS